MFLINLIDCFMFCDFVGVLGFAFVCECCLGVCFGVVLVCTLLLF